MAERLAASGFASGASAAYASGDHAGIGVRLLAYALDSIVMVAFAGVFATLAFLAILLSTDSGYSSPSDGSIWVAEAFLIATIPAWLALNVWLGIKRGQTVGQYVVGLRVVTEEGEAPAPKRWLLYWLALHPLLFHPVFAGFWALFAYLGVTIAENTAVAVFAGAMTGLCLVAPLFGLGFALSDPQRRAIHDRLAGARVVRLD
ncbi:MAG TPA: RDD family protein [Dehalococcoidia bacterium]|nr:RDD family protein [Dehalococcoidia bacterium]